MLRLHLVKEGYIKRLSISNLGSRPDIVLSHSSGISLTREISKFEGGAKLATKGYIKLVSISNLGARSSESTPLAIEGTIKTASISSRYRAAALIRDLADARDLESGTADLVPERPELEAASAGPRSDEFIL